MELWTKLWTQVSNLDQLMSFDAEHHLVAEDCIKILFQILRGNVFTYWHLVDPK